MIGKRYQQHRAEDRKLSTRIEQQGHVPKIRLLSATQFLQSAPTKTVPPSLYLLGGTVHCGTVYSHKPLGEVNPFLGGPWILIHYLLTSSSFHSQMDFQHLVLL